jgi:hypothetical protein
MQYSTENRSTFEFVSECNLHSVLCLRALNVAFELELEQAMGPAAWISENVLQSSKLALCSQSCHHLTLAHR